jgi:hypothetical protein
MRYYGRIGGQSSHRAMKLVKVAGPISLAGKRL